MTTSRKLEEIVSNLDDMSETIDEIKDRVETEPIATEKLDRLQTEMTRAADLIEESLDRPLPTTDAETPGAHSRDS